MERENSLDEIKAASAAHHSPNVTGGARGTTVGPTTVDRSADRLPIPEPIVLLNSPTDPTTRK